MRSRHLMIQTDQFAVDQRRITINRLYWKKRMFVPSFWLGYCLLSSESSRCFSHNKKMTNWRGHIARCFLKKMKLWCQPELKPVWQQWRWGHTLTVTVSGLLEFIWMSPESLHAILIFSPFLFQREVRLWATLGFLCLISSADCIWGVLLRNVAAINWKMKYLLSQNDGWYKGTIHFWMLLKTLPGAWSLQNSSVMANGL